MKIFLPSLAYRLSGIDEGSGTTRHLFELLTRYLQENLAPGAEDR